MVKIRHVDIAPILATISNASRLLHAKIRQGRTKDLPYCVDYALLQYRQPWEMLPGKAKDAFTVFVMQYVMGMSFQEEEQELLDEGKKEGAGSSPAP